MSLLGVLNLVGYSTGAALHLWMAALVARRRRRALNRVERVLLALAVSVGLWHTANLIIALHALLGLDRETWDLALRLADTCAVINVTFCYSFLLHIHLHLWANARSRPLTRTERARVLMSYIPTLFLLNAIPRLWVGPAAPMFEKLANLVLPFALWSGYVLALVAATDLLIARLTASREERLVMRTLAASFLTVGALILAVHAFGIGSQSGLRPYLETLANLGSLLPTALLAYYIYRYRYLELAIKESLVVASFAAVILVVYLFGIRTFGAWLTARWDLNPGSVEALLILALALVAAPLRRWLDRRFHRLFEREAALYRDVVARIGVRAGEHRRLEEMIAFVEHRTAEALGLEKVRIATLSSPETAGAAHAGEEWITQTLELSRARDWAPIEGEAEVRAQGYRLAYPLRREGRLFGLLLAGEPRADAELTPEIRAVLEVLAGQVAVAIEERRLIKENVQLERRLAQGERLAALGQMAATIAHEVRNPLSSIKSIAQVMREDEALGAEYGRDIELIVGETDRLNRTVTQLLSFARRGPSVERANLQGVVRGVVDLFQAQAAQKGILIELRRAVSLELEGETLAALRDALSNLLLNAIQATPIGGRVTLDTAVSGEMVSLTVTDGGAGVPAELRERIWEPFFTTKQRGTGLGLAIVRKRMEEVGGTARLLERRDEPGAQFELRVRRG